jgi:hypothetical protein
MMLQAAEMSQALLELDTAQQQMVIQLGNNARLLKYESSFMYLSVPLCNLFPISNKFCYLKVLSSEVDQAESRLIR